MSSRNGRKGKTVIAVATALALLCPYTGASVVADAYAAPLETIDITSTDDTSVDSLLVNSAAIDTTITLQESPLTFEKEYNQYRQDYLFNSSTVLNGSNLHVNARGKLERVSSGFATQAYSPKLIVEEIGDDFAHPAWRKEIPATQYWPSDLSDNEYAWWGGFYSGMDANYVVTGASNRNEDDNKTVFRVTKFSKDWEYLSNVEIKGSKTVLPFDCGSCAFAEVDGLLHVRTCHKIYKDEQNVNHQSFFQFIVDEKNMTLKYTSEGNWPQYQKLSSFVSHSFNQYLAVLNGGIYNCDQGDANPRGIILGKLHDYYEVYIGEQHKILELPRSTNSKANYNCTGVSVGGFEASSTCNTLISAGNKTDLEAFAAADYKETDLARNVWVAVTTPKTVQRPSGYEVEDYDTVLTQLTTFDEHGDVSTSTPHLVKISDDKFLVLWNEKQKVQGRHGTEFQNTDTLKYQFIDGRGNKMGDVMAAHGCLSSCKPVIYDNKAVWYMGVGNTETYSAPGAPVFLSIDINTGEFKRYESSNQIYVSCPFLALSYDYATGSYQNASLKASLSYLKGLETYDSRVTVKIADRVLEKGVEYEDSFTYDLETMKGAFEVTGIGKHAGWADKIDFSIECNPEQIQGTVTLNPAVPVYDGKPCMPNVTVVTSYGRVLKEGVDYDLSFRDNDKACSVEVARAEIKGKGWYTGTLYKYFKIDPIELREDDVKLDVYELEYVSGKGATPNVTVVHNGKTLSQGSDYSVQYYDNWQPGEAYVVVRGFGNYGGAVTVKYKVVKSSTDSNPITPITPITPTTPTTPPTSTTDKTEPKQPTSNKENDSKNKSKVTSEKKSKVKPTIKVSKTSKTVKAKAVKKKAQTFKINAKSSSAGKLTYKVVKSNKKVRFTAGKAKLKKGVKKGTYSIQVKVSSAARGRFTSGAKTFTITFKVV